MLYVIVVSVTKCNIPAFNGQRVYSEWLIRCACIWQYLCCIFSVAKLYCGLVQPIGLSRLSVFKEVHLTISSFLEAVFEVVDRWYDLLRKELQSSITVAMIRHQFPTVTSSNLVFGSVKEDWPRSCSETLHHFEDFSKWALFQRSSKDHNPNWWSLFIWQAPEMRKQACKPMLNFF